MSYKPFMGILGKGLVTAQGAHWQHQRLKLGPVLRYDMLENVADIAHTATLRFVSQYLPIEPVQYGPLNARARLNKITSIQ